MEGQGRQSCTDCGVKEDEVAAGSRASQDVLHVMIIREI
jgi:hypothetical protein